MSYPKLIHDVKSNINIVDVVSLKVKLKPQGQNLVGLCPFHNEKTPSFTVSPSKNIFTCFGCGKSGNAIDFIEETENLIFHDIILKLAKQANLNVDDYLEARNDSDSEDYKTRKSILIALEKAQEFYVQNLADEHYNYFEKRGISSETLEKFGIGYAPKNNILLNAFKGFSKEILLASGLISKNKNQNHYYDFFYDSRIVFPIYDKSQIVSFAGRTLSETVKPKYTNFRNTIVSEKKNNLFGLHLALKHIVKSKSVFVVEGYTDVMMIHQEAYQNVVAKCGTSFTEAHAQTLAKYAKRIIFVPDSDIWEDEQKFKTFEKEINISLEKGFECLVVKLENGHDPCSLQHNVKDALQKKHDAIEFLANHYFTTAESVTEKGEAVEKVAELIAKVKVTSQEFYITEISKNQKITKTVLKKAVNECIPTSKSDDKKQDEEPDLYHIKVRDTFFELTISESTSGAINEIYVSRKRSELEKELGDLSVIPRFSGIRVEPSHTNFRYTFSQSHISKRTRGKARNYSFVNWYNPLPYDSKKFDVLDEGEVQDKIGTILDFFKHIFGDKYLVGLDYVTILYQFPKRKLPALALVSRLKGTGKSTFLDLMKEFFGANATISSLSGLLGNFNAMVQGKLLCMLEETRDERGQGENKLKDMITNEYTVIEGKGKDQFEATQIIKLLFASNFPNSFLKITDNEDRFFVVEVPQITGKKDNKLKSKMIKQLSHFRYFLENREIVHKDEDRLWFKLERYETQALRNVKEASKNPTIAAIEDLIRKIFLFKLKEEKELFRSFKICSKTLSDYMNEYYNTKKYNKIWLTKTLKAHDIISSKNSTRFTYPSINFGGELIEWKRTNARWYEFEITDYLNSEEIVELYDKEEIAKLFSKEEIESRNIRSKGIEGDDGDDCPF